MRATNTRNMLITNTSSLLVALRHCSQQTRLQNITGQPGHHRNDAQADERRQEAQSERSGDQHPGPLGGRGGRVRGVLRDWSASSATPSASAAPEDAERRASRSNASVCGSTDVGRQIRRRSTMPPLGQRPAPAGRQPGAAPGPASAARTRRSRPRRSTPPCPPPGTTASTSRLDATASGSGPRAAGCGNRRRYARAGIPARARTVDGPAPIHNARANNTAAVLMPRPDR